MWHGGSAISFKSENGGQFGIWYLVFGHTGRVPCGQDDATIGRVVLDLVDALAQLIDTLACVIGVHIHVLGAKVSPLESVHRSQVALGAVGETYGVEELAGSVAVPDLDALGAQLVGVGAALYKPQEFLGDATPEEPLGGEQREHVVAQTESVHGMSD